MPDRISEGALTPRSGPSEPPAETTLVPLKEKQTDAWHRQLRDGRVEIMCKAPGYRLRVSAPEGQAWEAVELFEKWTGLTIGSDRRPPRVPAQLPGQLPLAMNELESSDNGAAPCGTPDEEF